MDSSKKITKGFIEEKFYVYLHIKETNGEPFYVGKGHGKRKDSKSCRNRWWKIVVEKHGFDTILLEENISESKALELELYWINRIGKSNIKKGPLVNITDGGGGVIGYIHTEESKEKIRNGQLGNKHCLGKKASEEHKKNISLGNIGKHFGKTKTLEVRKKISEKLKGVPLNRTVVLDTATGVFYISIFEAAKYNNIKHPTLRAQLRGVHPNKTTLLIV